MRGDGRGGDVKTHPEQPHLGCTDAVLRGEELGGEKEQTMRVALSTRRPGSVTDTDKRNESRTKQKPDFCFCTKRAAARRTRFCNNKVRKCVCVCVGETSVFITPGTSQTAPVYLLYC